MNKVELQIKINDNYITLDLDQNTNFNFNYELKDLQNPSVNKVSFSKNISLPQTKNNNRIFDELYQLDSNVNNFNTLVRTPFRLYINYNLFEEGYIKLETITDKYNIRLFGGLGEFFYMLSQTDDTDSSKDFRIKNLNHNNEINHIINGEFINKCWSDWNALPDTDPYKQTVQNINYVMSYQGYYDDFDNKSAVEFNNEGVEEQVPVQWNPPNYSKTLVEPEEIDEHRFTWSAKTVYNGEYRSYMQKPTIRFKWLFNKIVDKCNQNGWEIDLDDTFFSKVNPYFENLWICLPNYEVNELGVNVNSQQDFVKDWSIRSSDLYNYSDFSESQEFQPIDLEIGERYKVEVYIPFRLKRDTEGLRQGEGVIEYGKYINYWIEFLSNFTGEQKLYWAETGLTELDGRIGDLSGTEYYESTDYYRSSKNENDNQLYIFHNTFEIESAQVNQLTFNLHFHAYGNTSVHGQEDGARSLYNTNTLITEGAYVRVYTYNNLRSENEVTFSDNNDGKIVLFKSDITCLDLLLSYGKLFDLYFIKDRNTKKVSIKTRNNYFEEVPLEKKIIDWTKKIDRNKGFTITPVYWDFKFGEFKYNNLDSKYENEYKSLTKNEYGSFKFDTGNQHSEKTLNLLDGTLFDNCVIAQDTSEYYLGRSNVMFKDNKVLPHFKDKSNEGVDINMVLLLRDNNFNFTDRVPINITDDSTLMLLDGFCWNLHTSISGLYPINKPLFGRSLKISSLFDDVTTDKTFSLNFGNPSITYYSNPIDIGNEESLYHRFWKKYIEDIYNVNTKELQCNVYLDNSDIQEDLFNKFIRIDNTLWRIQSITDFNPINPFSTKVKLLSVQDINAYTSQDYMLDWFTIYLNENIVYDARSGYKTYSTTVPITGGDYTFRIEGNKDYTVLINGVEGTQPHTFNLGLNGTNKKIINTFSVKYTDNLTITHSLIQDESRLIVRNEKMSIDFDSQDNSNSSIQYYVPKTGGEYQLYISAIPNVTVYDQNQNVILNVPENIDITNVYPITVTIPTNLNAYDKAETIRIEYGNNTFFINYIVSASIQVIVDSNNFNLPAEFEININDNINWVDTSESSKFKSVDGLINKVDILFKADVPYYLIGFEYTDELGNVKFYEGNTGTLNLPGVKVVRLKPYYYDRGTNWILRVEDTLYASVIDGTTPIYTGEYKMIYVLSQNQTYTLSNPRTEFISFRLEDNPDIFDSYRNTPLNLNFSDLELFETSVNVSYIRQIFNKIQVSLVNNSKNYNRIRFKYYNSGNVVLTSQIFNITSNDMFLMYQALVGTSSNILPIDNISVELYVNGTWDEYFPYVSVFGDSKPMLPITTPGYYHYGIPLNV